MQIFLFFVILFFLFPLPVLAQNSDLDSVNQKVSSRFENDMLKLSAIMEELRRRKGITETRVAFGGVDTQIKSADYWITYTAEALAYQRAQKFTSKSQLRNSLEVLKNKILKAKQEVRNALAEE